ncbi:MAG: 16S rRNA (guanine(966)-N(2))-methyltransferase RsmD [Thermoleophilia bacterium]|nr:16S rRNA (guanine(966)-N(2))-methyltransferase RsmD [Thermoleophilia bacterium]
MRIIAGTCKGTIIAAPKGSHTRPTADKVRGAIFNMLGDVSGLTVLDLFAGSGALGLEALSRGAAAAVLADSGVAAAAVIQKNIAKLRMENVRMTRRDYLQILKQAAKKGERYDLIFVDPPYKMHRVIEPQLSRWLPKVITAGGRVIVESDSREEVTLPFEPITDKVYGDTRVRIFMADDGGEKRKSSERRIDGARRKEEIDSGE